MKTYRRIEITAFRRRVIIVSGASPNDKQSDQTESGIRLSDADSSETIKPESEEGQRILIEALRVLEEKIVNQTRRDFR